MKHILSKAVVLPMLSFLVFTPSLVSQIKQDPKTKMDMIQGEVRSIDQEAMTFVIRTTANLDYTISYTDKTTFRSNRNPKGTIADVQKGLQVVAIGKAKGTKDLAAAEIDILGRWMGKS